MISVYLKYFLVGRITVDCFHGRRSVSTFRDLIELVVKPDVLQVNSTAHKLATFDVGKKEHLLPVKSTCIGNGAKQAIAEAKHSDKLTPLQELDFYKDCQKMICTLVSKLQ